jgi:hypothetical protein
MKMALKKNSIVASNKYSQVLDLLENFKSN